MIILIENNATGQLGQVLERHNVRFSEKLLKYNGRPIYMSDVEDFITNAA